MSGNITEVEMEGFPSVIARLGMFLSILSVIVTVDILSVPLVLGDYFIKTFWDAHRDIFHGIGISYAIIEFGSFLFYYNLLKKIKATDSSGFRKSIKIGCYLRIIQESINTAIVFIATYYFSLRVALTNIDLNGDLIVDIAIIVLVINNLSVIVMGLAMTLNDHRLFIVLLKFRSLFHAGVSAGVSLFFLIQMFLVDTSLVWSLVLVLGHVVIVFSIYFIYNNGVFIIYYKLI